MATKHASKLVSKPRGDNWGAPFAEKIDDAISVLAGDHEIVSVAVLPLPSGNVITTWFGEGNPDQFAVKPDLHGAIITVVWREP